MRQRGTLHFSIVPPNQTKPHSPFSKQKLPCSWKPKTAALYSKQNHTLSFFLSFFGSFLTIKPYLFFILLLLLLLIIIISTSISISMRLSCNGCRVLRRGCTVECPIRRSVEWISCPQSQSNATLFLAKFYGRQGLLNLLSNAPSHLQPAVFKSLLYEACGRMVNPVFGSTGLLTTGNWHLCEAAANAVLNGAPIQQAPLDGVASQQVEACDIRHVAKSHKSYGSDALHRVKSRSSKFKRRAAKPKVDSAVAEFAEQGSVSHDCGSGLTRASENKIVGGEADSSCGKSVEPARAIDGETELQLTLGWGPVKRSMTTMMPRVGLDLSG